MSAGIQLSLDNFKEKYGGGVGLDTLWSSAGYPEAYPLWQGTVAGAGLKKVVNKCLEEKVGGGGPYSTPVGTSEVGGRVDHGNPAKDKMNRGRGRTLDIQAMDPYDHNNPRFHEAMQKFHDDTVGNIMPAGSDQDNEIYDLFEKASFARGSTPKNEIVRFIEDLGNFTDQSKKTGGKIDMDMIKTLGKSAFSGVLAGALGSDSELATSFKPDTSELSGGWKAGNDLASGIGSVFSSTAANYLASKFKKPDVEEVAPTPEEEAALAPSSAAELARTKLGQGIRQPTI